jgi:hypothetical protein
MRRREMRQPWQHACKLILNRAPVDDVTRQLGVVHGRRT